MDLRVPGCQYHLVVLDRGVPHLDIVGYGILKQRDLLIHDGQRSPKHRLVDLAEGLSVEEDLSAPWLIEPRQQLRQRGFSASGRADKGDALSGLKLHVEILDQGLAQRRVAEGDIPHLDPARELGKRLLPVARFQFPQAYIIIPVFHDVLDPLHLRADLLNSLPGRDEIVGRCQKLFHIDTEGGDHTGSKLAPHRQPDAHAEHQYVRDARHDLREESQPLIHSVKKDVLFGDAGLEAGPSLEEAVLRSAGLDGLDHLDPRDRGSGEFAAVPYDHSRDIDPLLRNIP